MSATEILDQLISGDGKPLTMKITIIPGWTVEDVANYLVEIKVLSSAGQFLRPVQIRRGIQRGITSSKK